MPGGGPPGAPAGGGSHRADGRHGSLPAASRRRQRLTRRPGYMRSVAGVGIGFLSPAVGTSCWVPGGPIGKGLYHSKSEAGRCSLDPSSHCKGSLVGIPFLKSSSAPDVASGNHLHLAQSSVRETPVGFGVHPRAGNRLPERLTGSCRPGDCGRQQEFSSMDSSESPGSSLGAAWSEGTRGPQAMGSLASLESSTTPGIPALPGSQDIFASSFSFIQLSLGAAGERGEAEGCLPSREAESPHLSPQGMGTEASSSDRQHEDPRQLWAFSPLASPGSVDMAQVAGSSSRLECSMLSSLDTDTSQDPSIDGDQADKGSGWANAHGWDALLKEWEPVLQDCLRSHRRQLEVTSLSLKLQKLQEKAIDDGDYDKAEALRQRLEDLEQEKGGLPWALPSQQPALGSFLGYLAAQTQVALSGATQRTGSYDPTAALGGELKPLKSTTQDNQCAAITRREWLIQEKQQVQKAIEALQARSSALEAEEQQLERETEGQETRPQWPGCDLTSLLTQLSPDQMQEVSRALGETLAYAGQVPFYMEPPGTLRSLQERTRSLNLAVREVTAQLCSSERLCSSLRRRLSDLDTRLPVLLEAKMLAVSGSHFCTAKELSEEIWALSSEREGLEVLLGKLLALSSRTIRRLGSVKEDYSRCRRDLALQEATHKANVKDSTVKYMEMLEGQLRSCRCPLLGRVWETDLEACQLLMQSLELQEAEGSLHVEDERQTGDPGEATWTATLADHPGSHAEEEKKTPLQAVHEWSAHLVPSPHCTGGEQKEESSIISAELGEKCEAISTKLLHMEDQLHMAMHSHDEALLQSLWGELQMVKETLQAMILQLQQTKEGGEATASCPAAGTWEAKA
uniref:Disrupted in schizophrenia 1 n=1 Tax=Nannospalax galili TaxID=1026970 RepID=A0A8C6QD11_NANGA